MANNKDNEDTELFQQAVAGINRNHRNYREQRVNTYDSNKKPASTVTRQLQETSRSIEPATTDITEHGDSVLFVRSGLQRKVIKKLKRGDYAYDSVLDLHGMRIHEAETLLEEFLSESIQQKLTCILIIHGKGYHSENNKGVLKPFTINWLKYCADIKAFCSANPRDGGTGAMYVLLKRRQAE